MNANGSHLARVVPLLLLLTGRSFGVSSSLRHMCAATLPSGFEYFRYDWRRRGLWNLLFVAGIFLGGLLCATVLRNPNPIALSQATVADLQALGVAGDFFKRLDHAAFVDGRSGGGDGGRGGAAYGGDGEEYEGEAR